MAPPTRRRRSTGSKRSSLLSSLLLSVPLLFSSAAAQAPLEPADGSVYLGAWVDTSKVGNDTPSALNTRLGKSAYAYQMAQTIPLTQWSDIYSGGGPINETYIELTGTSAAIFLTVFPVNLYAVTDDDFTKLGNQILSYQSPPANRSVFLRFAPEMQGGWMPYGTQPTQFKTLWVQMYKAIKAIAPATAIVWSPNAAQGYPYGAVYANISNLADQLALDTSPNGQLDSNDDAYSPYYPGDAYVDWCGLSWYWKGTNSPYVDNEVPPTGYTDGILKGMMPPGSIGPDATKWTPFYQTYCAGKNKPCAFSEFGAAFHINNSASGASQLSIQQSWWQESITNQTFLETYPKIKMFMLYEKQEQQDQHDLRDFRITMDDTVRQAFLSDLSGVESRYIWSTNQTIPESAIQSAAGSIAPTSWYTGKLSLGMPVQTKNPSVFSGAAQGLRAQVGVATVVGTLVTLSVGFGGWVAVVGRL